MYSGLFSATVVAVVKIEIFVRPHSEQCQCKIRRKLHFILMEKDNSISSNYTLRFICSAVTYCSSLKCLLENMLEINTETISANVVTAAFPYIKSESGAGALGYTKIEIFQTKYFVKLEDKLTLCTTICIHIGNCSRTQIIQFSCLDKLAKHKTRNDAFVCYVGMDLNVLFRTLDSTSRIYKAVLVFLYTWYNRIKVNFTLYKLQNGDAISNFQCFLYSLYACM